MSVSHSPPRVARNDVVAVRDAFGEWHPATARTGVVRGHKFPVVWVVPMLRGRGEEVPIPAEDVIVLEVHRVT